MPDFVIDGDQGKYIGYEHIGESYSGARRFLISDPDYLFAKEIAEYTKDGIFLDLACGDGCFTVPAASLGIKIIAGDISNKMMRLLQERASYNDVSLKKVTLARMNALAIPLADESVDTVVANGVLHLISNPEKVIKEIWRVLKRGGAYLCLDDRPGQNVTTPFDNSHYFEIVNYLYQEYWKIINQKGITPQKYSWKFDRNVTCDQIFQSKTEKIIERNQPYEISLDEGFLPRLMGKGFSDQVSIPNDIHQESVEKVLNQAKEKFGVDFGKVTFKGIEDNLIVTIFIK